MFKTFRNFPRKRDAANANPQQPVINTFIIDGIADTSKGVWISPTRNQTADDGTLHIGLMNPFGLANLTTVVGGSDSNCVRPFIITSDPNAPCNETCNSCDCRQRFDTVNGIRKANGDIPFDGYGCLFIDPTPSCDTGCVCTIKCRFFMDGPQGLYGDFPCWTAQSSGDLSFDCTPPGVDPPDQVSTIIREVERFLLDLDINSLSGIDPDTITSATLRLPIKRKLDWM